MISQEVFLEAEAPYSTGLAGGFFTLKITKRTRGSLLGSFFAQLIECDTKKVCELYGGGNAAITTSLDVLDGSARYSR